MGRVLGRKLIFAALIAAATMLGVADASAQAAKPPENQAATISNDAKSVRAKLDAYKADLDQRESALQGRDLSSRELQTMRLQIEPITESIFAQIESMTPRLEAAKARLDQLGPKPKEGQPEESADVAQGSRPSVRRPSRNSTRRSASDARSSSRRSSSRTADRRPAPRRLRTRPVRAEFRRPEPRTLAQRRASHTAGAARAGDRPRRRARLSRVATRPLGALLLVGLALGAAIALYVGRQHVAPRLVTPRSVPSSIRRAAAAFLPPSPCCLLGAVPAIAGQLDRLGGVFDCGRHRAGASRADRRVPCCAGLAFVAFRRGRSPTPSWRPATRRGG